MNRKARRASLKGPYLARSATLPTADLLAEARRYHQQGQSGRAQDICNLILKREPRHVHALNLLGLILQRAGHHRHAARILAEAVASDEFNAACHYNLGSSYQALNETTKAAFHFNRALALGMSEKNSEDFILQNPSIGMCVARIEEAWPLPVDGELFSPATLEAIANDIFFRCSLESVSLHGIPIERLLIALRGALLGVEKSSHAVDRLAC